MNNVLTAKNSFQDGLLMDFAPENTGAGNLTNALNATLVTFNGNEMVLQNDMGNGRVETARLPEGFIPVGTCEFGDIIYIVSYNPITNKSQIGCFPSPERNISSDEISNSEQSISFNDFQELTNKLVLIEDGSKRYIKTDDDLENYSGDYKSENGDIITLTEDLNIQLNIQLNESFPYQEKEYVLNRELCPTGKLKKTSVKKVIVETKKLNPGDKYILYTENKEAITANKEVLSGYGIGSIEQSPKNLKLHVVSIEDSGKITYLDTTTKWYDIENGNNSYSDYLINYSQGTPDEGTRDLDSYRDLLESNWSIFSSKVSGKLAILAELETIDTFSCSYDVELIDQTKENGITYNNYELYLYPEYTSKHESIKPAYIVATESKFARESVEGILTSKLIYEGSNLGFIPDTNKGWELTSDGKINTGVTFKIPYTKSVKSVTTSENEVVRIKSDALIYTMQVTPAMNYGMLDHLAQDIIIDFNKIGTGEINLTTWKYHNSETTSILTFGLESYPKPNHEIKAVIIDFYDAQGLCAEYVLQGKKSYNGVFTEYIQLGQPTGNFRFKNKKLNTNYYTNYNTNYNNLINAINILQNENASDDEKSNSDAALQNILKGSGDPDVYVGRELLLEKAITYRDTFISNYFTLTEDIIHYSNAIQKYDNDENPKSFKWELPREGSVSDANTIYPNNLYKVVIKVYSAREDNKSNLEVKSFYRWYWTTSMFNDYYYNCNDFEILKFQLELDANVLYFSKPNFVWKEQEINNLSTEKFDDSTWSDDNIPQTFSANKVYIGDDTSNLRMSIQAGLINDYGCFNLHQGRLSDIEVNIYLGGGNIIYDNVDYNWSIEASNLLYENFLQKKPLEVNAGDTYDNIDSTNIQNKVNGLSDFYDLSFADGKEFQEDPNSQYQYYSYGTTLNTCYYKNESERKFINLLFKSILYNKAYITDLKSSKITVPVYKPVVYEVKDLQQLGLSFSEINEKTRLYFPECITLGNNKDSVMTARLNFTLSNNDQILCNQIKEDDNVNSTTMVGNISVSNIKDLLKQTLPEKGVFFLVYPAWSKDADKQADEFLVNLDSTEKWRSLYWVSENGGEGSENGFKNMITGNIIDVNVDGNKTFKVDGYSQTPFLAVKVNDDTCYILNNAYASQPESESESESESEAITQAPIYASNDSGKYTEKNTLFQDNFAAQLYYLFSNVYHRNCQIDNIAVNVGNIVSNNPFEATLTRDIVVSLKGKEKTTHNIIFNGMDFNQYVNVVYSNINPVKTGDQIKLQDINNDTQNNNNIILNFIERGVQSQLTVTKKVDSLFAGSEIPAYYYTPKNELKPLSEDLLGNTFYIRQNDTLSVYKDEEELLFNPDETCFSYPLRVTKTKQSSTLLNEYYNKYKEFYNSIKDFKLSIQIPNNGELQDYIDAYFNPDNQYNLIKDLLAETNNDNFNDYLSNSKASGKAVIINGDTSLQFPDSYYNKMGNYALFFKTIYQTYKRPEEITDANIEITSVTNSNPSTIKVTKFLGFELEEPWEITQSELDDDYKIQIKNSEPINFKLKDSTEFIQINPIISGNFISFEFPDEGGVMLVTNCQIRYKNYIFQFKGQDINYPNQIRCTQEIGDNYYTPNNLDKSLVDQGEITITRADTMPNLTPIIADCIGFKCGLGLNQAFTYTNKLEATVDYGGSFGFGGDDSNGESEHDIHELGTAYWINIGSKQQYLDSHFKLDNPDQPDPNYWVGIRDINTINNGNE